MAVEKQNKEQMIQTEEEQEERQSTQTEEEPAGQTEASETPEAQHENLQEQVERYKDLLLRKAAEFDNFKRRKEQEMAAIAGDVHQDVMVALLPVLDDFERSLKHSRESSDYDALQKGIEMIFQKLSKVLEGRGLQSFETVGKEFDVALHDALLQIPNADVPSGTVLEEAGKGYMLNGKVIRHAKVIVSAAVELPATKE
jgi:molecular chaperone GrpE